MLLPGESGLDSLRYINYFLSENNINPVVILDNVQNGPLNSLLRIIDVSPTINYLLLSRPWEDLRVLEEGYGIKREELIGWSTDTIAHEFLFQKCPIDPLTCSRVLNLTGGLPLFINATISLAKNSYKT
jgi:hypothetical protein